MTCARESRTDVSRSCVAAEGVHDTCKTLRQKDRAREGNSGESTRKHSGSTEGATSVDRKGIAVRGEISQVQVTEWGTGGVFPVARFLLYLLFGSVEWGLPARGLAGCVQYIEKR